MNTQSDKEQNQPEFAEQRQRMVDEQLVARGIQDERVLNEMGILSREEFVPQTCRGFAYEDRALPIGFGQSIAHPFSVAYMIESLELTKHDRVLEIGTGSGYTTAVLAHLTTEVHSIERFPRLAKTAQQRLQRMNLDHAYIHVKDGSRGLPEYAPFNCILIAASADHLAPIYLKQLENDGRIVIPRDCTSTSQVLFRYTRRGRGLFVEKLGHIAAVPVVGFE